MKNIMHLLVFSFALLWTEDSLAAAERSPVAGAWVGKLRIPHGPTLRVGVNITESPSDDLAGTLTIVEQKSGEIPFDTVEFESGRVRLGLKKLGVEIEGAADFEQGVIEGEFRQGGGRFPLILSRSDSIPVLQRPQEPKRPFPYVEEQVEYTNAAAGVKLAGTFTYPDSGGRFPAVVLLTGSGPQNRDEEFLGHKPFLVLSDYLTRHGIAVLRADDRGVGGSKGDFGKASTSDFADDAVAGVAYLKTRKEVGKIGVLGHSEGGVIAPLAASRCEDVAFVVMMAGAGVGLEKALINQVCEELKAQGASPETIASQRAWREKLYGAFKEPRTPEEITKEMRRLYAELGAEDKKNLNWPEARLESEIQRALSPWWFFALTHDPAATLRAVRCPVLAINGSKDRQNFPQENLRGIEKALLESGHKDFLVKEMPGLNHFFQTCETGGSDEYGIIEETISPAAMELICRWIRAHGEDS